MRCEGEHGKYVCPACRVIAQRACKEHGTMQIAPAVRTDLAELDRLNASMVFLMPVQTRTLELVQSMLVTEAPDPAMATRV